ncbi:MAG TPA: hypothetical protein PLK34_03140 [Candidatus Pacearchaeota archaeon]|nr:hypothetical protein [Candidatus Pacearchaeota archaeon]
MKSTRKNPWKLYLLSFVITTIIFITVFLFSYSISFLVYQKANSNVHIAKVYIQDLEGMLENVTCTEQTLFDSSEKLDFVGDQLSLLETRFSKQDVRVLEQKRLYSELQLAHFKIIKELNKKCDQKFIILFFFYSNSPSLQENSERVGYILSTFKKENPNKIMIYSFDTDLNYDIIEKLKQDYNVTQIPEVVINEKQNLVLENINQLEVYLE